MKPRRAAASAAAVIVAAGSGRRMGGPKQFLPLAGRPLVHWSVETFLKDPALTRVAVVLTPEDAARHGGDWSDPRVRVVTGGATRLESVRLGVAAVGDPELIAVHDGARPLVEPALIAACLEAARRSGAAVPGVPVKDTLKEVSPGGRRVVSTPDRGRYWAAQTPQCYRAGVLRQALASAKAGDPTDESQLVEALGVAVEVVLSTARNLKITTPEDLLFAEALLRGSVRETFRTGIGYDVHRLVKGRPLWLAGVRIPHAKGLDGHSDADVVLHAVCDALLGAAGAGEVGELYPPGDPKTKGISSRVILAKVLSVLAERKARVEHVDVVVIAQEPPIRPLYPKLRGSLAGLLGLPPERLNLKAKTKEGLGEIGRGEAIACHAVATLAFP